MRSVVQFMPRLTSKNIARARGNRRDLLLSAFFPKKGAKSGVSRRTARAAAQEGSRRLVLSFYNGSIALQRRILSRYERSVNRVACPSRGSISSLGFFARSPPSLFGCLSGTKKSIFSSWRTETPRSNHSLKEVLFISLTFSTSSLSLSVYHHNFSRNKLLISKIFF